MAKRRRKSAWNADGLDRSAIESRLDGEISNHEAKIVETLGAEPISVYRYLADEFAKGAVDKNLVFQFVFRSFYRLDNAGITPDFKSRYFEILERHRGARDIDMRAIARELRPLKSRRDRETLQFSFITKLAATAEPEYPIYDSKVGKVFGFPAPYGNGTFEEQLETYMRFYSWLRSLYPRLLDGDRLRGIRRSLEAQYPEAKHLPSAKVIDFIFWTAGKLGIVVIDRA